MPREPEFDASFLLPRYLVSGHDDAGIRPAETSQFSRWGVRWSYDSEEARGQIDFLEIDNLINLFVNNCIFSQPQQQSQCHGSEELFMIRATLVGTCTYRTSGYLPIKFDRPELVIVHIPKGISFQVDVGPNLRNQSLVAFCCKDALERLYDLRDDQLPDVFGAAREQQSGLGTVISLPMDGHLAEIVAEMINTPLEGELRRMHVEGGFAQLVACAIHTIRAMPVNGVVRSTRKRDIDLVYKARDILSLEYAQPPTIAQLAQRVGMNQNKIKQLFRIVFGTTLHGFCVEQRMRHAHVLLLDREFSIKQIAELVGYEHQSSFTAAFADFSGMSPREYRQHRAAMTLPLQPLPEISSLKGTPN